MRTLALFLVFLSSAGPSFAQQGTPSIMDSVGLAVQQSTPPKVPPPRRGRWLWPGVVIGASGTTASLLALTALRVEHRSAGNSPDRLYRDCVELASTNPIYATNDCSPLKGANMKLLWTGVAAGALGAVMIIGSIDTNAQLVPGGVRVTHRIQF